MKYNGKNLNEVLGAHKKWLNDEIDGERADLSGVDLREKDLMRANLSRADLSGANLIGANLSGANLMGAYLSRADLIGADLRGADLVAAYLDGVDLRGADLRGADLMRADLMRANLSGANLSGANLMGANLMEADFRGAYLMGADLRRADLSRTKSIPFIPMTCPDSGSFIGWKKCLSYVRHNEYVIVKLLIPEDAKRSSATGRKCRCDKAVVLEIQNMDGTKAYTDVAYSQYATKHFAYKIGETVVPEKPFDDNRWIECASGIHFFINRQEAVDY